MTAEPATTSSASQLVQLLRAPSGSPDVSTAGNSEQAILSIQTSSMTTGPSASGEVSRPPISKMEPSPGGIPPPCAHCGRQINERYLLKSMEQFWHEDCLTCACCKCRLAEAGSTLYFKNNMLLCRRDYLRLYGLTGMCAACQKSIPAFEMVMRARNNVYHLECFACQECQHRFCVGDKFYLCDNKILCEYDYEERLVFAQMAYNYNTLTQMKQKFQDLDSMDEASAKTKGRAGRGL